MNIASSGKCRLVLPAAALVVLGWSTAAAAERDEGAAREYVYCGRVTAAWETVAELRGMADAARGMRTMRSHFVVAATLRSDTEFLKQEIQNSSQRFKQRFPGQDVTAENRELEAEGDRCAGLWKTEVKPLLELK